MAVTIQEFNTATKTMLSGLDITADSLYLALVSSAYTFDATDSAWADISANEVATGDGYTTGGELITNVSVTQSSGATTIDADDVVFAALTKTFMGAVIYASGTFDSIVNPVLFYIKFDAAATTITAFDFIVKFNTAGIKTFNAPT